MLDVGLLSVLYLTDSLSSSGSPIVSLIEKASSNFLNLKDPKHVESLIPNYPVDILFILTRNSHIIMVNSVTGTLICSRPVEKESLAISMYIVGKVVPYRKQSYTLPLVMFCKLRKFYTPGSGSFFSAVLKDKHPEQLS